MVNIIGSPQSSRSIRGICCLFGAIAILFVLPGFSQASDPTRAEARQAIRQIKGEIDTITNQITAVDVLIIANKAAIAGEQNKPNPDQGVLIILAITKGTLEAKKDDLKSERQDKKDSLDAWEAYLRRLGG